MTRPESLLRYWYERVFPPKETPLVDPEDDANEQTRDEVHSLNTQSSPTEETTSLGEKP